MPAGRPTKLTPEAIEKAEQYIAGGYIEHDHFIPSHAGLAVVLNVGKRTIYQWAEDKPEKFSHILEKCNVHQESILLSKGLNGEANPTICKLALGKHGYHERQEVTGADGQPVKMEQKVSNVTFTGPDGD